MHKKIKGYKIISVNSFSSVVRQRALDETTDGVAEASWFVTPIDLVFTEKTLKTMTLLMLKLSVITD